MRSHAMPWKDSSAACEQRLFIETWLRGEETVSQLCRRFQISRKTGYKRINRFRECGDEGLGDLSRAPRRHPNATSSVVARQLIEVKQAHPTWGPKKVVAWLRAQVPHVCWPASSTAGEILNRAGLVKRRHRRRRTSPWSQPLTEAIDANDVWCMDFKGWFRTGDGMRIDPLTVQDAASRYLLACSGLTLDLRGHRCAERSGECFESMACPGLYVQTTARHLPAWDLGVSRLCRYGGSSWVSRRSVSSQVTRSRMGDWSDFTGR